MDVLSRNRRGSENGFAGRAVCAGVLAMVIVGARLIVAPCAAAQSDGVAEYQVKAAFLFNFVKFVEWPDSVFADARAPIVLGILGDNPFGDDLRTIVSGQLVRGRPIRVQTFKFGDDLRACHVVFVSASERAHMPQILISLRGADVLTVSDLDSFASEGGVMQFVMEESRVRFLVNLEAAAHTRLRINSKLLALARVIHRTDP
jgi:hypothetical protein